MRKESYIWSSPKFYLWPGSERWNEAGGGGDESPAGEHPGADAVADHELDVLVEALGPCFHR